MPAKRSRLKCRPVFIRLCTKSFDCALLCATSAYSVSLWFMNSEPKYTTEAQRTLRLHREIPDLGLFVQGLFILVAVLLLAPAGVEAQTSVVTMTGTVSEVVALSVLPNSINGDVVRTGNTVRMTVPAGDADASVIRVPLLVRSNSSFRISATVESNTAEVTQLSVTDVRATGTLVSPQAISELNVPRQFDVRGLDESNSSVLNLLDISRPVLVASGPRVSRGGTLVSPNNALQITLLIRLKSQPIHGLVHLTFVATTGPLIQ